MILSENKIDEVRPNNVTRIIIVLTKLIVLEFFLKFR
jgi:hypothetical protein